MVITYIKAKVTFLNEADGGRVQPLTEKAYDLSYRPHIVMGSKSQREAVVTLNNGQSLIRENYLGVALKSGPKELPLNQELEVTMVLINDYREVKPGNTFTVREGVKIVAYGDILEKWSEEES